MRRGEGGRECVAPGADYLGERVLELLERVNAARRFAHLRGSGSAIVTNDRPQHEQAVSAEVISDVRGNHAVIGDDMTVSGGTLAAAAGAMVEAGALDVRAFATHALCSERARDTLDGSALEEVAVTDTVALDGSPDPPGPASSAWPISSGTRSARCSRARRSRRSSPRRTSSSELGRPSVSPASVRRPRPPGAPRS